MNSDIATLLPEFKYSRTLGTDPLTKTACILGSIKDQDAILKIEKSAFQINDDFSISQSIKTKNVKQLLHNDVYYTGLSIFEYDLQDNPDLQVTIIWPATEIHIKKYDTTEQTKFHMISETPEIYNEIVKPYIEELYDTGRLQWVKNILHNGAEAERIVYRDDDIVILPDLKWDGIDMDSLYLVGIVCRDDIRSIRDLNSSHITWLKSIKNNIYVSFLKKYGHSNIKPNQLRLFVHYQPSYYHFHIHIVNVKYNGLGNSITAGKAILLDDIIDLLEILGCEGFMKKNINYIINEQHDLWTRGLCNYVLKDPIEHRY
ncbi:hypothetical protein TBLA_0A09660 [Henningerozyma blattae CBS 6284]|uniref:M7GpppX diphosphatase n=1 Tax=Henningerozyma blattae (strain ATCC 34711 / CBS 6284 / DSM 70876 / NBRC 10599 / NRRL Y-10934 / UCD 77-7) TaxID=1071380 RepID=I2GX98_HENB6|nr:hypothetical protein TBLA_0A09660 [Tetrapisispora blattae CBS 6284]CCH58750.1 hypothetical protein TBLA_0A09660 [Tetrapisispora blattae CBS 6284]